MKRRMGSSVLRCASEFVTQFIEIEFRPRSLISGQPIRPVIVPNHVPSDCGIKSRPRV